MLSCPFAGCKRVGDKGFSRQDNLTQHRRRVHKEGIQMNPVRFGRVNGAMDLEANEAGPAGPAEE